MGSNSRCPRTGRDPGMHTSAPPRWGRPVLRKGTAAAGPSSARRSLRREETQAPAAMEVARRAPRTARATHRGALGQIVATQSVVQVEADHVAGGQGEVLSHCCAGNTGKRLCAGRVRGALEWDARVQTRQDATGLGGAGRGCIRPWDAAPQPVALPALASAAPGHASPRLPRARSSRRPAPPFCRGAPGGPGKLAGFCLPLRPHGIPQSRL